MGLLVAGVGGGCECAGRFCRVVPGSDAGRGTRESRKDALLPNHFPLSHRTMAKKQRETAAPTPATPVVSRDSFQRLSYLYQASLALASILPSLTTSGRSGKHRSSKIKAAEGFVGGESGQGGKTTAASEDRGEGTSKLVEDEAARPKKRRRQQPKETSEALKPLSRHLAKEMIEVSKKATVRMCVFVLLLPLLSCLLTFPLIQGPLY